jgi:hypothetical protein
VEWKGGAMKEQNNTFLDRLHIEVEELYSKINKLNLFLNQEDVEVKVGAKQFKLLGLQLRVMNDYACILEERIRDLEQNMK